MSGRLRSLSLCRIRPETRDGTPGWRKARLKRAAWMIPPGNLLLRFLDIGYVVCGRDWARHETETFRRAHADFAEPRIISETEIWLPHLPGVPLAELTPQAQENARIAAFAELGRLHRLGLGHGDPHRRNLLYDGASGRCRIIDFETRFIAFDRRAQALDAAILALDFARSENHPSVNRVDLSPVAGLDNPAVEALAREFIESPGARLRYYWRLLGYRPLPVGRGS